MMILLQRALHDLHDRRPLTYLPYCYKSSLLSLPAFTVASLPTLIERKEPLGAVKGILSIASDNIHTKATKTLIKVCTSSSYRNDTLPWRWGAVKPGSHSTSRCHFIRGWRRWCGTISAVERWLDLYELPAAGSGKVSAACTTPAGSQNLTPHIVSHSAAHSAKGG